MEQRNTPRKSSRRQKMQKNRHLQNTCLILLFSAAVLLFGLIRLFSSDRAFSDTENRSLAQKPSLSADALSSGEYSTDLQAYSADQFPGRDFWVSMKQKTDILLGKEEANGVYLCKDDYLIEIPTAPDEKNVSKNIEAINTFAEENEKLVCRMCIVPNAVYVLSDKLPDNAPGQDQALAISQTAQQLNGVELLDVTQTLLDHKQEPLYYRTDHHWTSLAAKYAFEQIASSLAITPVKEYDVYTVSDTFEGTLSSKSGTYPAKDRIEIYVPKTDVIYTVNYAGASETGQEGTLSRSMYVRERLNDKNQYTVFFGGNYPQITVDTTADCGKTLLLFKDSYANCFVQFLYPYYDHILIVDPRYYTGSISSLIRQNGVTDVLFFYNYSTWSKDTSLANALAF